MEKFSFEQIKPAEEKIELKEEKEKTLMEKLTEWKRAFAVSMALGAFGVGLEAVKPGEVHAAFQKEGERVESVIKDTKAGESKEFLSKDGYKVKYKEGEKILDVDSQLEGDELKVNFINLEADYEGHPDTFEDDVIYLADFMRYSTIDGKEHINYQVKVEGSSSSIKNPYKEAAFTEKIRKSVNPALERQRAEIAINWIHDETMILKFLKESGKRGSQEYQHLETNIKKSIEKVKNNFGEDSIREQALDELMR